MYRKPLILLGLALALLSACSSKVPLGNPAPIDVRQVGRAGQTQAPTAAAKKPTAPTPSVAVASTGGATPAGFYRTQKGDTLMQISRTQGVSLANLIEWNNLKDPEKLETDQLIRIQPPAEVPNTSVAVSKPITLPSAPVAASAPKPSPKETAFTGKSTSEVSDNLGQRWVWPAPGKVFSTFTEKTKGIDIRGKRGDAVHSAADGRVSIAGVELPGYGKLIIIKHSDALLTAYGYLDQTKVTEGELVRRGQIIATMATSPSGEEGVHFEIRSSGKPINPLDVLP